MQPLTPRRVRRRALLVGAPAAIWCACASNAEPQPETAAPATIGYDDIVDVIYRPGATDEGVLTLLNARTVKLASSEPVVTVPADASQLTTPATFTYLVGATALRALRPRAEHARALPAWLVLERSAFAHGAPMNGDAFFLVFSTSHEPKLLRVFTQDKTYVPTDDEWQRLAAAGAPITLTLTRGIYEQGRLTSDGGPFVGKPVHFTVAT